MPRADEEAMRTDEGTIDGGDDREVRASARRRTTSTVSDRPDTEASESLEGIGEIGGDRGRGQGTRIETEEGGGGDGGGRGRGTRECRRRSERRSENDEDKRERRTDSGERWKNSIGTRGRCL